MQTPSFDSKKDPSSGAPAALWNVAAQKLGRTERPQTAVIVPGDAETFHPEGIAATEGCVNPGTVLHFGTFLIYIHDHYFDPSVRLEDVVPAAHMSQRRLYTLFGERPGLGKENEVD